MIVLHTVLPFSEQLCSERTSKVAKILTSYFEKANLAVSESIKPSIIALAHYVAQKNNQPFRELRDLTIDEIERGCIDALEEKMSLADTAIVLVRQLQEKKYRSKNHRLENMDVVGFPKLHAWNVQRLRNEYNKIAHDHSYQWWYKKYMQLFSHTGAPELRNECYAVRQQLIDKYKRTKQWQPQHEVESDEEKLHWAWYWQFQFPLPYFVQGKNPGYLYFETYNKDSYTMDLTQPQELVGRCLTILLSPSPDSVRQALLKQMLQYLDTIRFQPHDVGHAALYMALKQSPEHRHYLQSWITPLKNEPEIQAFLSLDELMPLKASYIEHALQLVRIQEETTMHALDVPADITGP